MRLRLRLLLVSLLAGLLLPGAGRAADQPVVWVDQGHGQVFQIDREGPLQLTALAQLLARQGLVVKTSRQRLDPQHLQGVSALLISGAFQPYTAAEIEAIHSFVAAGGKLAIMLHIAPPLDALLASFGVAYSNGVIRDPDQALGGEPLNFAVTRLAPHPLTRGVKRIELYGVWALTNMDDRARIIARTSPHSWVDLNGDRRLGQGDAVQSFGVLVAGQLGKGGFAIFGDDALFQNRFIDGNHRLAVNLAHWLAGREHHPALALRD